MTRIRRNSGQTCTMQEMAFDPADAKARAGALPEAPAVFALYGAEAHAEPYIGRTPNLRGRLERLLQPSAKHPRRLQLAGRVRRIAWRLTGSEFESLLAQFSLLEEDLRRKGSGADASAGAGVCALSGRQSLSARRGDAPAQPARGGVGVWAVCFARGSGAVCGRDAEAVSAAAVHVDELDPDPSYPGCVYSEMKMCLAPVLQGLHG